MTAVSPDRGTTGLVPSTEWLPPVHLRRAGRLRAVPAREWDALMERLGTRDSYFRAGWSAASALLEPPGTRPVLLHFEHASGEIALPLLTRPLPDGAGADATSAYGYGGPVGLGHPDVALFGRALDAWAHRHGVVTTFLRLHPLLANTGLVPPRAELVEAGRTVAWDTSPGRALAQAMHRHHRRAARQADRAGLEVTVRERPPSLEEFRDLYVTTMDRQRAGSWFYFPEAYWDSLCGDDGALEPVLVEGRLDGVLVAALLCFADGPWLHYHLGASADAARSIGASQGCFLAAAEYAQGRGLTGFHLGGGLGGDPSSPLFEFKQRYDPTSVPLPFTVARLVHDRVGYRRLAGSDSTAGFFPPWRRPA